MELQETNPCNLNKTGFFIALATAMLTLFTFIIAFLTPPLSGPFCQGDCFQYPYHTIAHRFPRDYYWMFPAMVLSILYVIFILAIYESGPDPKRKISGKTAIALSIMSSTVLLICYYTQVTIIQPSLLKNETEGIALWSQFNPHGLFIALEELGYILMNLSFLFIALTYSTREKLKRIQKWILFSGVIVAGISFIVISFRLGIMREYIFEVAIISINWLILIIAGFLQSRIFFKAWKQ